jgi:hypothetical protein
MGFLVNIRLRVLGLLERFFRWLEYAASDWGNRVAVCPDCGRNRYSGRPCVGEGRNDGEEEG